MSQLFGLVFDSLFFFSKIFCSRTIATILCYEVDIEFLCFKIEVIDPSTKIQVQLAIQTTRPSVGKADNAHATVTGY